MQTHKVESRKGMTEQDVLDLLNDNTLLVFPDGSQVESVASGKVAILKITERESQGSTYRFVEVCRNGKKKKIALHRLVWMAEHRTLVPDGFDVDHIDGPSDAIGNLRLLPKSVNRSCTARSGKTVPDDSQVDEDF